MEVGVCYVEMGCGVVGDTEKSKYIYKYFSEVTTEIIPITELSLHYLLD